MMQNWRKPRPIEPKRMRDTSATSCRHVSTGAAMNGSAQEPCISTLKRIRGDRWFPLLVVLTGPLATELVLNRLFWAVEVRVEVPIPLLPEPAGDLHLAHPIR